MRDSKNISITPGYETANPLYGPAYIRQTTTDTSTTINGTFRFSRAENNAFQYFLAKIRYGIDPFTMMIDGPYGLAEQTCQAMPGSFNPSQTGESFSYNVTIVLREWAKPPLYDYSQSFNEIGWLVPDDFCIFDRAINSSLASNKIQYLNPQFSNILDDYESAIRGILK